MRGGRRWGTVAVWAGLLALGGGAGCHHTAQQLGPTDAAATIAVPPPGAVPRELDMVTLPPYVIGAPDVLLIEVVERAFVPDPDLPVPKEGQQDTRPKKWVTQRLPVQAVTGQFHVRPDGMVNLGVWGTAMVSGLTLEQAADAVRRHIVENPLLRELGAKPENVLVILDVMAYNSKRYYIIYDGAGFGEQVVSFPITGGENVLDAIANVGGLSDVASKRNIWVARRTPHAGQPWQILPVDWVGVTQHGISLTNYQVMPGDRIYVKAQKLVLIDRTLSRIFAPIERVFGITLLGASTVNQIQGRGNGFNGN